MSGEQMWEKENKTHCAAYQRVTVGVTWLLCVWEALTVTKPAPLPFGSLGPVRSTISGVFLRF